MIGGSRPRWAPPWMMIPPPGTARARTDDDAPAGDDPGEPPLDLSLEEIDDFEILAEADADDEDLLAAHGEHEASDSRAPRGAAALRSPAYAPPSELDFAARLDLGDDSDRHFVAADASSRPTTCSRACTTSSADRLADSLLDELRTSARPRDPLAASAGHALAGFDLSDDRLDEPAAPDPPRAADPLFEPESSSSFTLAGIPSDSLELEPRPPVRREPAGTPRPARIQRAPVHRRTGDRCAARRHRWRCRRCTALRSRTTSSSTRSRRSTSTSTISRSRTPRPSSSAPAIREATPGAGCPAGARGAGPRTQTDAGAGAIVIALAARPPERRGPGRPGLGSRRGPRAITTDDGVVIDFDDDD